MLSYVLDSSMPGGVQMVNNNRTTNLEYAIDIPPRLSNSQLNVQKKERASDCPPADMLLHAV